MRFEDEESSTSSLKHSFGIEYLIWLSDRRIAHKIFPYRIVPVLKSRLLGIIGVWEKTMLLLLLNKLHWIGVRQLIGEHWVDAHICKLHTIISIQRLIS